MHDRIAYQGITFDDVLLEPAHSDVLPKDVELQSVYPHAHYLAKDVKGFATLPDGTVKPLIWIKAWDFRWQDQYRYAVPLFLPTGTTLTMRFTYDNSAGNPRNRNPPQRVRNGPLSSDEMGVLGAAVNAERATKSEVRR